MTLSKLESVSVVIPVYNDQEVLNELYRRCEPVLNRLSDNWDIIFVDDGSVDDSFHKLIQLYEVKNNVRVLKLARNFGQQNAISAGLDFAKGDFVVIMDSDLQDKPEDIPLLLDAMQREQKDMAIAKWISRKDSPKKKFLSKLFFNISKRITNLQHEPGLGVFRVIKRSALNQILDIPEKTGTILSLMYWSGIEYSYLSSSFVPTKTTS